MLGQMEAEHEHVAVEAIGLKREPRDGRDVAIYTWRCAYGHRWEEVETDLGPTEEPSE